MPCRECAGRRKCRQVVRGTGREQGLGMVIGSSCGRQNFEREGGQAEIMIMSMAAAHLRCHDAGQVLQHNVAAEEEVRCAQQCSAQEEAGRAHACLGPGTPAAALLLCPRCIAAPAPCTHRQARTQATWLPCHAACVGAGCTACWARGVGCGAHVGVMAAGRQATPLPQRALPETYAHAHAHAHARVHACAASVPCHAMPWSTAPQACALVS